VHTAITMHAAETPLRVKVKRIEPNFQTGFDEG